MKSSLALSLPEADALHIGRLRRMSGQETLLMKLRDPDLTALSQRVTARAQLEALDVEEAADYLRHHVRRCGAEPAALFTDEALELLARRTQGLPRLLNHVGHQALQFAADAELEQVDCEVALEALAALGLEDEDSELTNEAA